MTKKLKVQKQHFLDQNGDEVHLKGVNLGGSTKMPFGEPNHFASNFSNHQTVSFVGRPFPLSEAHEHFARLQHWGFNFIRFLVTWEAVEHAGRGQYDTEYLDYLTDVVALAGSYGFYVYIDPHQDVWSRMTGGDGAPAWTLTDVGFDLGLLDVSESAITMQRRYPDYPTMAWTDNYSRLACMTMFTLFFAGNRFAPDFKIAGLPVQDYLQDAFLGAMRQVALRLKDMPHVIGYGPLNEPGKGFIGLSSMSGFNGFAQRVAELTAGQALLVGSGCAQTVPKMHFTGEGWLADGEIVLNPLGVSAWKNTDIWHELGLWGHNEAGEAVVLKDDFFAGSDFLNDALLPFTQRYIETIRTVDADVILFVESTPTEAFTLDLNPETFAPMANASHWYDEQMLFTRYFTGDLARDLVSHELVRGRVAVQNVFNDNIGRIQAASNKMGVPTVIGEFGLAYDINEKTAFDTGDFSLHELALTMYYNALDAHLVHSAQWNYTADNDNRWGDHWNGEDLSIFSRDQQFDKQDIHSGGRAVKGFCRPFLTRVGGLLRSRQFDVDLLKFTATLDAVAGRVSIIYVPDVWFNDACFVTTSGVVKATNQPQIFEWWHDENGEQMLYLNNGKK